MLEPPVEVMRPTRVARLPTSMPGGAVFQVKLDGHRIVALIGEGAVTLQSRSGRIVTRQFGELLEPLGTLPAGTVLDGEVVAVRDGRFDFHALAGTAVSRRKAGVGVAYVAFDVLQVRGEDVRSLPLVDRLAQLTLLLAHAPTGVDLVTQTADPVEAKAWMPALAEAGVEGWVAKALDSRYDPRDHASWRKWRVADTVDATVLRVLGPAEKPRALRVRLEDGTEATTGTLGSLQARQVAQGVREAAGEPVEVEVRVEGGGVRRNRVTFVRVRPPD